MQLPNNLASLNEALNKLPQKKIIQTLIVLLICYIAYILAQITWLFYPQQLNSTNTFQQRVTSQSSSASTVSINSLLQLNLFGQYNSKPQVVETKVEVQEAPETRLNLTLSGVVATQNKTTAAAIIQNANKQETYGIGDKITGTRVTVEQILSDRVLLKQSGRLETLMLDGLQYTKTPTTSVNKQTAMNNKPSGLQAVASKPPKLVDQRKNTELSQRMKELRADIKNNPGKILDYLRISPQRSSGKIIGYQLSPGKKPELFTNSGLKSGDIAVQMNSFDLTIPAEAGQALNALKQEQEVSLLIDRNGELNEIIFSIDNN